MTASKEGHPRVLLVLPTSTYRASDFLDAARVLGAEVVVASEEEQALSFAMDDRFVRIDLCDPERAARDIVAKAARPDAVVGVDEQGVEVAALVAERLGLSHNPPDVVRLTRDKARMREVLSGAGLAQPRFRRLGANDDAARAAAEIGFPVVVKATGLSGSRGVIRADDAKGAAEAAGRVRSIAGSDDGWDGTVLVESFVPGAEVAVEGLLVGGRLEVLAVFDKPDPLEGPYFEETIYVTPSRLPGEALATVEEAVRSACRALGLVEGPIHAEVRLPGGAPVVIEVAARSIGGLCSRTLSFGAGVSLEQVILRHALGLPLGELTAARAASGVMMIPIRSSGTLIEVGGTKDAAAVPGIAGIEITVPVGHEVEALPEGDRYLGFMFATGPEPTGVEAALRAAHARLRVVIG